jgi:hypothetical protein
VAKYNTDIFKTKYSAQLHHIHFILEQIASVALFFNGVLHVREQRTSGWHPHDG